MSYFYQKFGKGVFDLFLSLFMLFISWPVILVVAILIKLGSSGPVIFKQKRIGKNGRIFTLFKFRTMVRGAEKLKEKYLRLNEADGPVFKIRDDPRYVNGIGKFLAHSGLDELPNIFNVLKGDLSWVGPRPFPVEETKKINHKIQKIRNSVLPGITSTWVISGAHDLTFKQWMRLDQAYIKKISFSEDLKIIRKTALLVLNALLPRFFFPSKD